MLFLYFKLGKSVSRLNLLQFNIEVLSTIQQTSTIVICAMLFMQCNSSGKHHRNHVVYTDIVSRLNLFQFNIEVLSTFQQTSTIVICAMLFMQCNSSGKNITGIMWYTLILYV